MAEYLVIQAARFGDLLQTGRLLASLEQHGTTHLAIDKSMAPLARLVYPNAVIHKLDTHGSPGDEGLRLNEQTFGRLQTCDFSKIFNCNYSPLTAQICRLFPPEKVIGNRPAHDFAGGIRRSSWSRLAFRLSAMRPATPLNLVDYWGYFASNPAHGDIVNPPPKAGGGGIGVVVSGREARRSLPAHVLAPILETVFRLLGKPPIKLLGSKNEIPQVRKILKYFKKDMLSATTDMCGKTDLPALCEEIEGLDLLLTPDTGIMHLAARMAVPVMAFFLSSAWCHETGPYGGGHIIWQAVRPCSPCLESAPCPYKVACLEPFADPAFGRSLAQVIGGKKQGLTLPANLQCWATDTDDFGAVLRLMGGEDTLATKRETIRSLLSAQVCITNPVCNPAGMDEGEYGKLVYALFPDDEWMLPPWRYY